MWQITLVAFAISATIAESATIVAAGSSHSLRQAGTSFISTLQFKHKLRICNAYPYTYPMDVYLGKEKLTSEPMSYRKCGEFSPTLKDGDKLDFRVGGDSAGSFSVSELPENDAIMVLVIHRHDTRSTAVSFESHVFANLLNAQIAVLDTYKGAAKSTPYVQDVKQNQDKPKEAKRSEELRYDSVVAVNPGLYEVVLTTTEGESKARHELVALQRESYIVVRCGVEAEQGQAYPQQLIIFPQSDPRELSGAAQPKLLLAGLVAMFTVVSALCGA